MKMGHVALMVCCLGLASVFLVNCGSSNSPSYGGSATATPTPLPAYTISGTVTYQGGGSGSHIYVLFQYQNGAGPASITGPLASGASYSFSGLTSAAEVGATYDTLGNGLAICGNSVKQTNCNGLTGSGDIVCIVGYTGATCPANANGTLYSTTTTVPIVFGGTTGQSGTNCTE